MKIIEKIKKLFNEKESTEVHSVRNPIVPVLTKYSNRPDIEIVAAKLGFALKIVFADGIVAEEEKEIMKELIENYLPELKTSTPEILNAVLEINNFDLEMIYFAQAMNEKLEEVERQQFLLDLFRIARVDNEYASDEESVIRIICKYLLINHTNFIKLRNQT